MREQYKIFEYNNEIFDKLYNVTLSNELYVNIIRGDTSIIEEKISGRDIPYFYGTDISPLEFEITFAINDPIDLDDLKILVSKLLYYKTYKPITFGEIVDSSYVAKTPVYYVVFTGQPKFEYTALDDKVVGYFTLNARCNAPYGFYEAPQVTITIDGSNNATIINYGDDDAYIDILLTKGTGNLTSSYFIKNYKTEADRTNNVNLFSSLSFNSDGTASIYANEIITFNSNLRTFTSNNQNNIYDRWDLDYLKIFPGINYIKFSTNTVQCKVTVKAPQYIKE